MIDFNNMVMSDFFDYASTTEGQEQLKTAFKKKIEDDPETVKRIGEGLLSLYGLFQKVGETTVDHIEELQGIFKFFDKVNFMPESEARSYLEEIFDKVYNGQEIPEEKKAEIIEQWYKKPDSFTQPLTKAVEKLFDGKTDFSEPTGLKVGRNKKLPVVVNAQMFVSVLDGDGGLLPKNLTPYDREVFNGYCSILASGQNTMTTRQIYEAMAGKTTVSPQALGAVTKSIRKMQTTILNIDWTEHARMKGLDINEGDFIRTEEPIIPARGIQIRTGGQDVNGYVAYAEPALFQYAKAVGQISTTDKSVLQIPLVSNTEENIVLKNYLLRHIEHLKTNKKWNSTLTFEKIFESCGIQGDKKKMTLKRKVVFDILDRWKETNYITGYDLEMKGRVYYALKISV